MNIVKSIKKRTMKYFFSIVLMALMMAPFSGNAQSAFSKFENSDNIGSVTINKGMLGIVASMSADKQDQETQDFIELAKSMEKIQVFISEDKSASAEMAATAKQYIKKEKLEGLMKVRDGDSHVDFYVKSGKDDDHVSELLMLVSDFDKKSKDINFETVLVSMTGDLDLTKVGSLVNKMNLPKDLKKVEKKK